MGGTEAVGFIAVAGGVEVDFGQGRPVVAKAEFEVVVVEFCGGFADDAGGFDSRGDIERGEASRGYVIGETFGHGSYRVGDGRGDIDFVAFVDYGFETAGYDDSLVVDIAVRLCLGYRRKGGKESRQEDCRYFCAVFHIGVFLSIVWITRGYDCFAAMFSSPRSMPTIPIIICPAQSSRFIRTASLSARWKNSLTECMRWITFPMASTP